MKDSVFKERYEFRKMSHQVHGQQLTVFNLDQRYQYPIYSEAESELQRSEGQVSPELYQQLKDSLIGFSDDMQMEIVDCIRDCVDGIALYTTGIRHIDRILWSLYHKIQQELANKVEK